MTEKREINSKVCARAVIAITLIVVWLSAALSGLILWLAPEGRQSGQQELLFGLTKQSWGDVHFWICVVAIVITVLHIIVDWKALRGIVRYMTSVHRDTITRIE
jgi:hypothetical protein